MKILIIGYSCSGKTFFGKKLSKALNIPVFHIDDVYYDYSVTPQTQRSPNAVCADVLSFLKANDSWVMDGGYDYTGLCECCKAADHIVFMKINRFSRLVHLYKRCKRKYKNPLTAARWFFHSFLWIVYHGCGKSYDAENFSSVFQFQNKLTVVRTVSEARRFFRDMAFI